MPSPLAALPPFAPPPDPDEGDDDELPPLLDPSPDLDGEGEDGAPELPVLPLDPFDASLDDEEAGDLIAPLPLSSWSPDDGDDEPADLALDLVLLDDDASGDDLEPVGGFDEPLDDLPDERDDGLDGPLAPDEPLPDDGPGDLDDEDDGDPPRLHLIGPQPPHAVWGIRGYRPVHRRCGPAAAARLTP